MKKITFGLALGAVLFALSLSVDAQQPAGKVPRIGYLSPGVTSDSYSREAFHKGFAG